MTNVQTCPGCGCTLQIPLPLAGWLVQCPACNTQFRFTGKKHVCTGLLESRLDRFAVGRFGSAHNEVRPAASAELSNPAATAGGFIPTVSPVWSEENRRDGDNWEIVPTTETLPVQVAPDVTAARMEAGSAVRSHRARLLMTLAIIGVVGLGICGTIAWRLAAADLGRMNRGEMDPSGRHHTETAYVLGLVGISRTLMELTVLAMVLIVRFL